MTAYPTRSGIWTSLPNGQGFPASKPLDEMLPHERLGEAYSARDREESYNGYRPGEPALTNEECESIWAAYLARTK